VNDVEDERNELEPKQDRGFKLKRGTVKPRQVPFLVNIQLDNLESASNCGVYTFSKVFYVAAVQSCHRDTAIGCHVNMSLLSE